MKSNLPAFLFVLMIAFPLSAQDIPCSSFCVTRIAFDSTQEDVLLVTILFTADDDTFINYPHVTSIIDQQGDTIATGTLNFFGQFANTSVDYPVTTSLDVIPDNFDVTVNFHFDTVSCALSYPCLTPTDDMSQLASQFTVFPNPSAAEISIHSLVPLEEVKLDIINAQGGWVCRLDDMVGLAHTWQHQHLPGGMYVLQLTRGNDILDIKKVIIGE